MSCNVVQTCQFVGAWLCLGILFSVGTLKGQQPSGLDADHGLPLHQAARVGDTAEIGRLLEAGADVNAKNRYRLTALYYAADRGHHDTVRKLLEAGAEFEIPNEPYYRLSPMIMAARKNHSKVVAELLTAGASCGTWTAIWPAQLGHTETVKVLVTERPDVFGQAALDQLAGIAETNSNTTLLKFLQSRGAVPKSPESPTSFKRLSPEQLEGFDGLYRSNDQEEARIWSRRGALYFGLELELASEMQQTGVDQFELPENPEVTVRLSDPEGNSIEIVSKTPEAQPMRKRFDRVQNLSTVESTVRSEGGRWNRFRGPAGSGIADGMNLPIEFDAGLNQNLAWKTELPGVGHSSPVVWGDSIFLTSAESLGAPPKYDLRVASGFDTHPEGLEYRWFAICVDLNSGKIRWKKLLHQGLPREQRHVMSSHANCTPSVDQDRVVVNLAGQGVFCLSHHGDVLWKKDLGKLASGWFMDPGYEWGFASSPVISDRRVFLQCDIFDGSFIAALDLESGQEIWRTRRSEISSWGTPLPYVDPVSGRQQVIANGTRAVCGYDAITGKELWRVEGNSEVTVASPIPNGDHVLVTGGYMPIQPIFSIDISKRGDLTPPKNDQDPHSLDWWLPKGGAYGITPIIYREVLYITQSNGVTAAYDATTGEQFYKQRVAAGRSGDIVASPIAADGNLYLIGGDGDVFVLPAGKDFQRPRVCPVGEQVMATPAAAPGRLIIRGVQHLYCFGTGSSTHKKHVQPTF